MVGGFCAAADDLSFVGGRCLDGVLGAWRWGVVVERKHGKRKRVGLLLLLE